MKKYLPLFRKFVLVSGAIGIIMILSFLNMQKASAHAAYDDPTPTPAPDTNPHTNGDCLGCHGKANMWGRLGNGEMISLNIVPADTNMNFHTQTGIGCKFCHADQAIYPHVGSGGFQSCSVCHWEKSGGQAPDKFVFTLPYNDNRDMALSITLVCQKCHQDKFDAVKNNTHTKLLEAGNKNTPVCVDCHTGHSIATVDRMSVALVCKPCHTTEYNAYRTSVHGAALEQKGNPDVPTCVDCHGTHDLKGPSDPTFRAEAATQMCGKCHGNKAIMAKYGISTAVLTTYMDDVHGRTNLLGQVDQTDVTKATCYDCHGTHDILAPSNPYSKVYPTNLQATCQKCHKDANITFPQAWLSHKTPTADLMPFLYVIGKDSRNVVYAFLTVVVIFLLLDIRRLFAIRALRSTHRK